MTHDVRQPGPKESRKRRAEARSLVRGANDAIMSNGRTVRPREAAEDVELTVSNPRQRADRRATAATRRSEEGSLRFDRNPGIGVVDSGHQAEQAPIVSPDLQGDRPLTRSRWQECRVQPLGDPIGAPQPLQTGGRQDEGVRLAAVEAAEPRVDVAVQRMHVQVGPATPDESDAAWTVGSDAVAGRKILQTMRRVSRTHDKHVAWVGSRQEGSDAKTRMLLSRDVLRAVNREVDPAVQ